MVKDTVLLRIIINGLIAISTTTGGDEEMSWYKIPSISLAKDKRSKKLIHVPASA